VAFTHDSRWLLTASGVERGPESKTRGEGQVQRWDLHHEHPESSSDLLGKLDVPARLLVTSFDGRWVAAAGQEGQAISLWDLQSEDPRASHFNLPLPDGAGVLAMAMSPSDEWLAVGCADGSLLVWPRQDLRDGTQATRLAKETASILLLTWSPDDRWLVAGGEDGVLRAWDFRSHAPAVTAKTLQGHEGKVISGALRADSRYLATAAWGEPARIWDLNADDPTSTVVVLRSQIQVAHVAFCPRSDWLATAGLFTTQLWDLDVESLLRRAELAAGRELTESELQQYQLIELSTKPRKQ
jgi:WD40 repeat protein